MVSGAALLLLLPITGGGSTSTFLTPRTPTTTAPLTCEAVAEAEAEVGAEAAGVSGDSALHGTPAARAESVGVKRMGARWWCGRDGVMMEVEVEVEAEAEAERAGAEAVEAAGVGVGGTTSSLVRMAVVSSDRGRAPPLGEEYMKACKSMHTHTTQMSIEEAEEQEKVAVHTENCRARVTPRVTCITRHTRHKRQKKKMNLSVYCS